MIKNGTRLTSQVCDTQCGALTWACAPLLLRTSWSLSLITRSLHNATNYAFRAGTAVTSTSTQ
jgi:hypothetical protein